MKITILIEYFLEFILCCQISHPDQKEDDGDAIAYAGDVPESDFFSVYYNI